MKNLVQDNQLMGPPLVFDPQRLYALFGKRCVDTVLALVLLPVLVPIIGLLYFLVRLDGGPGFFGHTRIGRDGTKFRCWKLRSMVVDAETKLQDYLEANPSAAAEWERDFKLAEDPRITRLGRILRKTSLDELPQLWNVLRGDMSFVGPRPVTDSEITRYGADGGAYLSVKPGVTGGWQVSGRNDVDYDRRIAMDVAYLDQMGLFFDLGVIGKTAFAVVNRTGK